MENYQGMYQIPMVHPYFLWLVFNVIFHRNEQGFGRFAV